MLQANSIARLVVNQNGETKSICRSMPDAAAYRSFDYSGGMGVKRVGPDGKGEEIRIIFL